MTGNFTAGGEFLRKSVKAYFDDRYAKPKMVFDGELNKNIDWRPSMIFKSKNYSLCAVEISEDKTYPMIFRMRHAELLQIPEPVSVYCVCPDEVYHQNPKDAKQLILHGYGLITVDTDGACHLIQDCIPIMNQILLSDFKAEVKKLPPVFQRRVQESFETYQSNPVSGLSNLCEILEGMVIKAGKEAKKKGSITISQKDASKPASVLDSMSSSAHFEHSMASIGTMRGFISEARNVANHSPKSKKDAFERLRKSKVQFIDGIRKIEVFRTSMKKRGLTGSF